VWVKGDRNPVKYMSIEDFGIDPAKLAWEPMPETDDSADKETTAVAQATGTPLTIAEAKRGLALTFNIAPSAVEITIRG
jgi:hypothetical protein